MTDQPDAIEYGDGTFRIRLCAHCGSLDWTVKTYGRITHKYACPHRQEPYHQGAPERTLTDERRELLERVTTTIEAQLRKDVVESADDAMDAVRAAVRGLGDTP